MYGLTQHIAANIDPMLFELIKLYASMLNGCAHCVDIHSTDALEAGESTARLFGLLGWYETPFFTARSAPRSALTEAATKFGPHGVPEDVFESARIEFDDRELTYVVAAIGLINMWNRFGVTFQLAPPSAATLAQLTRAATMDAAMLEQVAVAERPRLLGIAYRMTGSYGDAEDIVQEAMLRTTELQPTDIESPAAYLTTITTRLAIDHLRSARVRRESYVGPWLPEPITADPAPDAAVRAALSPTPLDGVPRAARDPQPGRASRRRAPRRVRLHAPPDRRDPRTHDASCRQLLRRARQRLEHGQTCGGRPRTTGRGRAPLRSPHAKAATSKRSSRSSPRTPSSSSMAAPRSRPRPAN